MIEIEIGVHISGNYVFIIVCVVDVETLQL